MTAVTTDPVATTDWIAKAHGLALPDGMFIGGEARTARSGSVHPITSPRDGRTLVELAWLMAVPFGGVKLSGTGRDESRHALDEYTDLKTTWINHG